MKSLLPKLTYALLIVIIFSIFNHQNGEAFRSGSLYSSGSDSIDTNELIRAVTSNIAPIVYISVPPNPIGMEAGESKYIRYDFKEMGNRSGQITGFSYQFYTQYDVPISDQFGPYPIEITINALRSTNWSHLLYLPESVVNSARAMDDYAIVLKTTFMGRSFSEAKFDTEASQLILLSPASFSKASPSNEDIVSSVNQSLQWESSIGAIDYEYCYDTIDNDSCDTKWTGTYDTNIALPDLPNDTTYYWQIRANNMAGTTYANDGAWWTFTTQCVSNQITVTSITDSGVGSLRQAISGICPGGVINFDDSLSRQVITLTSQLPIIEKALTIDATGLSIAVDGAGSYRIFEVTSSGNLTIKSLTVQNGKCDGRMCGGGGIYNDGMLMVKNCTFSNNSASNAGGAIYNGIGTVDIENSTFSGNSAVVGGGIFNWIEYMDITNSTFYNNTATNGGGIYINIGSVSLTNNTFSNNSATHGAGIYNASILHFSNNILANSISGDDCYNEEGAGEVYTNTHNLIETNAASPSNCGTPALTADPMMGPLADNSGPTQTMELLTGSPAIDVGDNSNCPSIDQRGVARPQGAACDIGAYEYDSPPTSAYNVDLETGWNLVSFNLKPVNTEITAVLASIDGTFNLVYAWDASGAHSESGNWMKYDPAAPAYQNSLNHLDETMGFWIHMLSPATLEVTGYQPVTTQIPLLDDAGDWNLVAYPSSVNGMLPEVLSDHGVNDDFSLVYAYHANDAADLWKLYDRTSVPYSNDLLELAPGWGYWIKVSADHDWSIENSTP